MRVLIRENSTSRFLANRQQWVPARTQALDFAGSILAVEAAERMGLKGVESVLDFGSREVVLKVPDEGESSAHEDYRS